MACRKCVKMSRHKLQRTYYLLRVDWVQIIATSKSYVFCSSKRCIFSVWCVERDLYKVSMFLATRWCLLLSFEILTFPILCTVVKLAEDFTVCKTVGRDPFFGLIVGSCFFYLAKVRNIIHDGSKLAQFTSTAFTAFRESRCSDPAYGWTF